MRLKYHGGPHARLQHALDTAAADSVQWGQSLMVDPRVVEAWSRMLKTMQASAETMEVLGPLAVGLTRDQLANLLARASSARPASGKTPPGLEQLEQVWAVLGVVPRYRHQELQERYDALRERLEEAEVTIHRLQKRAGDKRGEQPDARQVVDAWGEAVSRTLRMQADLMRSFRRPSAAAGSELDEEIREEADEVRPRKRARTPRRSSRR